MYACRWLYRTHVCTPRVCTKQLRTSANVHDRVSSVLLRGREQARPARWCVRAAEVVCSLYLSVLEGYRCVFLRNVSSIESSFFSRAPPPHLFAPPSVEIHRNHLFTLPFHDSHRSFFPLQFSSLSALPRLSHSVFSVFQRFSPLVSALSSVTCPSTGNWDSGNNAVEIVSRENPIARLFPCSLRDPKPMWRNRRQREKGLATTLPKLISPLN